MSRTRTDNTTTHTLQCIVDDAFYTFVNARAHDANVACADFVRNTLRDALKYRATIDVNTKRNKFASNDARNAFYANVAKRVRELTRELKTCDDARAMQIVNELRALRA